jgi:glycosidase
MSTTPRCEARCLFYSIRNLLLATICLAGASARAEVLLQYFETEWDEIYRRLPEMAEIGYEGLWLPPPMKSPHAGGQFAGGGNVGYSHFDKFDLGDIPQRGSLGTRYGTRGALRNLVDNAHGLDIKVYPDIVMNHFGNGPDYRTYPGTRPNDFHGWWDSGQPGGFKRPSRMYAYDDVSNGYGGTFQQELVSLIDLQLEFDHRFSTGAPNYATPPSFYRQPGQDEYYPYGINSNESTIQFINRWIAWLGFAMDYDGVRLDAPKHVIADFFGLPGWGFNHEIQYNYDLRRGFSDPNEYDDLYKNYIRRDDALIFSEFFIGGVNQVDYWRQFGGQGVKFRYLDFPRKSGMILPAFSNGDLAALSGFSGFSDEEGVVFCQSHDEGPPARLDLAYVYTVLHVGLPVVYFTGNNLAGSEVKTKTWVLTGHGGALGDYSHIALPNLIYVHNQFARGREWTRWSEGDFFVFERYDDLNANQSPQAPEGLLLVGLNDSGNWQTRNGVQTAFTPFTVLHDYSGNNPNDITVKANGTVDLSIPPGNNGQGWVCYAPFNASANGDPLRFNISGSPAPTMSWVVPGGRLATDKPRTITRLTGNTVDIDVHFNNPPVGTVNNVLVKWGQGRNLNAGAADFTGKDLVSGGFEQATQIANGHWRLTADLTGVPEGLHLVKARCFNQRTDGGPALFQTFAETVYVDRQGPDLNIVTPAAGATIEGDVVCIITNADRTASSIEVSVNGGAYQPATEFSKGVWRFNLSGLPAGANSLTVRAFESDWGNPRSVINTSTVARAFNVDTTGPAVNINFLGINNGLRPGNIELPFFRTVVSPVDAKLYWDGYELPVSGGTNVFDGRWLIAGVTNRLWGCFVNGDHFFEAVAVSGGLTNRRSVKVTFNLYGRNEIDSDGDGLPDNWEMPNFSSGTAPGPNVPWPGDDRNPNVLEPGDQDMIPNYGEFWTRLNPMNADTDYDGLWDADESGGSVTLGCLIRQAYFQCDNPYSCPPPTTCVEPDGGSIIPAAVSWTPTNPNRCTNSQLTVTYAPNQGILSNASPVQIYIGYNEWTTPQAFTMNSIGNGQWQYNYSIPGTATNVTFVFRNTDGTVYDNNHGNDWRVPVGACIVVTNYFTMNGQFDGGAGGANYEIANTGMKILAAVKSNHLYLATWSAMGGANDHFLFVTDKVGASHPAPWAKAGTVAFDTATKPYLAVEQATGTGYLNNGGSNGRNWIGPNGAAMELELDLEEVFGAVPEFVYVAAVAYGTGDGAAVISQCPPDWSGNSDLPQMEFLPVPIASIRDDNLDGTFDAGKPEMWTVVNSATNNANYDIRRFFLDERVGETGTITVILQPNVSGVTDVELFTNLNRRDFANLPGDEDPDSVTAGSQTTYYRAYPMTNLGGGQYAATLPVEKCGVYRINARYTVGGQRYYYTDNGLRRDCAVVVSPRKALDLTMYELNPLIAEATTDDFFGRSTFRDMFTENTNKPDTINTNYFPRLGVNTLWLQPIHPIGSDNRETDPLTGNAYDPGSPYAVRNYWKVNAILGDPAIETQAMSEFQEFVAHMDTKNVNVMLDGTFNHSAWDCEVGEVGTQLFPQWAASPTALLRDVRPQWYSKKGNYGEHATYYISAADNDIAVAPDRFDFGKWSDVADFNFGTYDTLVTGQTDEYKDNYLSERDVLQPLDEYQREVWQYFAQYPLFWLEKTGHPAGTPKTESHKGIDGLRCDFAQGLPSQFWEYTINRTRSVKWDFIFMAESLDGYRTVNGSNRHGLSYRSARQFDVLNENLVFYWRDQYFDYKPFGGTPYSGAQPFTFPTWQALDNRRKAYDLCPILLNLTGHDELLPHDDQWRVVYAYAQLAAIDGVPMLFYGQEAGLQNSSLTYSNRGINPLNNFRRYEVNFGKAIPNFKRYNAMTNVWAGLENSWKTPLRDTYARLNAARTNSLALRSQQNYFLNRQVGGGMDPDIFAVAKFVQPGVSVASQEVVFAFVNNNYQASTNRVQTFSLNATYANGQNWFGIQPGRSYNIVNLISPNPTQELWSPSKTGADLIANGITVLLTENSYEGKQAQFLKLIDKTEAVADHDTDGTPDYLDADDDNDGLPDAWEIANGLNPFHALGANGPTGDVDGDGLTNWQEWIAGTAANNAASTFRITDISYANGTATVDWEAVPGKNYSVEATTNLVNGAWKSIFFGTALTTLEGIIEPNVTNTPQRFYRARVLP